MKKDTRFKPQKNRPSEHKLKRKPTLYGFHAVREAWLNPERVIEALYLTPQAAGGFAATLAEAREKKLKRPEPETVDKALIDKSLPYGSVHQGVALCAAPLEEHDLIDLLIAARGRPRTVLVMLDQVTDPHNLGAILRSACVFGLNGLIQQKKHAPELDAVVAKTACGAVEHLPIVNATNLSRAMEELKEDGFWVVGLDERGEKDIGESLPTTRGDSAKIVLVLGSEGEGIRRLIRENCDVLCRLPASGPIQSLNVSNAAAVAFYAVSRI
ncbi:MAG: 23S rRNA (guanosine(2251)-2'-O)-methyltransferase RlmB [Alphaproteobacteria bacterium]|jgi:23S rRNA (guanosine2251-2'-O)-methyltransferase|nr:23S rRNA (guanosine(2251)-2'-O)-methyltransferase RlmB [Alphaproteobacteria bacterium]QQS57893.1 MAG: 23S rRNA (guanosine(2251)-2'-O)-methyltransferase RlmB [Alphaproteobacteria bacterium]